MYLAAVKYNSGDIDSALILIRNVPQHINAISRCCALAYAADIYQKANIQDTAFYYARELINSKDFVYSKIGYQVLLSNNNMSRLTKDSLIEYISRYRDIIETYLTQHESQEALMQHSFYNYNIQRQQRLKAEQSQLNMRRVIVCILFIVIVLIALLLYTKNREKNHLLKLHKALDDVMLTRQLLDQLNQANEKTPVTEIISSSDKSKDLREQLKTELLTIQRSGSLNIVTPQIIVDSLAYDKLQIYISQNRIITDSNPIWKDIEDIVIKSSTEFKHRLQLLTGGKLKTDDYHLALLIKCGVTPTQLIPLIGKTKGTISYRREMLCYRIFGEKLGAKVMDDIIRLL
jgi:hypothetical protein